MSMLKSPLVKNLPDVYAKSTDSNNYKLFEIFERGFAKLEEDNKALLDMLDLDNCTGKTLDMYGEMFKQPRGVATDSQYRYMIRAKIARYHVKSNYESIADAVCLTFNCDYSEFRMEETENEQGLTITKLPLSVIISAGFSAQQAISIIKAILPAGIPLESVSFEGTFEFGTTENEYDETAGFSDEEGHTMNDDYMGGYLGFADSSADEPILPI